VYFSATRLSNLLRIHSISFALPNAQVFASFLRRTTVTPTTMYKACLLLLSFPFALLSANEDATTSSSLSSSTTFTSSKRSRGKHLTIHMETPNSDALQALEDSLAIVVDTQPVEETQYVPLFHVGGSKKGNAAKSPTFNPDPSKVVATFSPAPSQRGTKMSETASPVKAGLIVEDPPSATLSLRPFGASSQSPAAAPSNSTDGSDHVSTSNDHGSPSPSKLGGNYFRRR